MSVTITGMDKLQKMLADAQRALSELNGTIAELKFDPADPASVAAAIEQMKRAVDEKVAPYRGNAIIDPLAAKSKEAFRRAIEVKVASAQG